MWPAVMALGDPSAWSAGGNITSVNLGESLMVAGETWRECWKRIDLSPSAG